MKWLIFKKLEDGSYGEKMGSYESDFKDDTSANRSYLMAEPMASHFELPEGMDEDCVELVKVGESFELQETAEKIAEKQQKEEKAQQEKINAEALKLLAESDFKVLRHIRQKALGQETSLSEEEYLALEQERSDAASRIVR